jgi:hypothetical protein
MIVRSDITYRPYVYVDRLPGTTVVPTIHHTGLTGIISRRRLFFAPRGRGRSDVADTLHADNVGRLPVLRAY